MVQTFSPDHPAIGAAERHDYEAFAAQELPHRSEFGYPPFGAMIRLVVRSPQEERCERTANQIAEFLRAEWDDVAGIRVLGAAPAPMPRLRGKYRFHLIIQGPRIDELREGVRAAQQAIRPPEDGLWTADVDPWDML